MQFFFPVTENLTKEKEFITAMSFLLGEQLQLSFYSIDIRDFI